jgi:hypothetical protein
MLNAKENDLSMLSMKPEAHDQNLFQLVASFFKQ